MSNGNDGDDDKQQNASQKMMMVEAKRNTDILNVSLVSLANTMKFIRKEKIPTI